MLTIDWVELDSLKLAPWRSTYVLKPDLEVIARSMFDHGWLAPLLVNKTDMNVVDGNYRLQIALSKKDFQNQYGTKAPVVFVETDDCGAQLLHLQLNRGRGSLTAKGVSRIVRTLLRSRKLSEKELKQTLAMRSDEFDLLIDGTLLKSKKISEHKYSQAWIPIEAPAETTEIEAVLERPPNADR
jgi:ParB-like chromosome segregation protein Spo0J